MTLTPEEVQAYAASAREIASRHKRDPLSYWAGAVSKYAEPPPGLVAALEGCEIDLALITAKRALLALLLEA